VLIRYSRPRVRPPASVALRLRRSHPLASGLVGLFVTGGQFGLGRDVVTGALLSGTSSPTVGLTPDGPALDTTGAAFAEVPHNVAWNVTGDITVAWRGVVRSIASFGYFFGKIPAGGGGGANTPFSFEFTNPTSGKIMMSRSNTGVLPFRVWQSGSLLITANALSTFSVSGSGAIQNAPAFYLNGVLDAATPTSEYGGTGTGAAGTNTDPVRFGRRADGACQMDGAMNIAALASRQWNADEHEMFAADPYALLEEAPLWHFKTVAALPDLAATITGTVDVTASISAKMALAATIDATIPVTALITAQVESTGDTHDGFVRRSRRERAMAAAEQRRRDEMAQEAVALRLSLEAAIGMAAEVAEEAPQEAIQAATRQAARMVPALADTRPDDALLASAREAVAALLAAVQEAERARALAEDDEEVLMLLRAL
jgi:hypothetical protein